MSILRASLLLLMMCPAVVPRVSMDAPAAASLKFVLAQARERIEASDFRATGRLVRVGADGTRNSYNFSMKARWFPDGLRLLCEITGPPQARVRLLLEMHPGGAALIETAHPGDKELSKLPFLRWGEGLLDTDFSYEDLMQDELFWQHQSLLGKAKYGVRDCYVVKSEPGAMDPTHYRSVTSWLDHEIEYPVHVEKIVRESGASKEYVYYGLRQTKGVWSANQVEAKTQGRPGSSLLIIERGSAVAGLERKDFDPVLLRKP